MSVTFLQNFYQSATRNGRAPVLGFCSENEFHWLPRWLLRSKAKHFALGLIHEGIPSEGFFYVFNDIHPNGIFAGLGALSLGLQTLDLPLQMDTTLLGDLIKRYPPAFVFFGKSINHEIFNFFQKKKGIKTILWERDPNYVTEGTPTFRKIFNQGIMKETLHFKRFRELRDSLTLSTPLSPIQMDDHGKIFHQPLQYFQIHQVFQKFSNWLDQKKPDCLFAQADFSGTLDRILGLYWPLFSGSRCLLEGRLPKLPNPLLAKKKPKIAYITRSSLEKLSQGLAMPSRSHGNWWTRQWLRHRLKRIFGSKIHEIWVAENPEPKEMEFWKSSPLPLKSLDDLQPPTLGNLGEN